MKMSAAARFVRTTWRGRSGRRSRHRTMDKISDASCPQSGECNRPDRRRKEKLCNYPKLPNCYRTAAKLDLFSGGEALNRLSLHQTSGLAGDLLGTRKAFPTPRRSGFFPLHHLNTHAIALPPLRRRSRSPPILTRAL